MTTPLSQITLIYDLEQSLLTLRSAAARHAASHTYLPRDLMAAAVAFTVQLAIESGHPSDPLRALERKLILDIQALDSPVATLNDSLVTALNDEDRDQIIDLYDALLAKGAIGTLSVLDQNLFRDCAIALGVVRCEPRTREEVRVRILRELHSKAPRNAVET